jgi:hypothetical protein
VQRRFPQLVLQRALRRFHSEYFHNL